MKKERKLHVEQVDEISEGVSVEDRIKACLVFFNNDSMSHYNALLSIGIDKEMAKKMDNLYVVYTWLQELKKQGIIWGVEGRLVRRQQIAR